MSMDIAYYGLICKSDNYINDEKENYIEDETQYYGDDEIDYFKEFINHKNYVRYINGVLYGTTSIKYMVELSSYKFDYYTSLAMRIVYSCIFTFIRDKKNFINYIDEVRMYNIIKTMFQEGKVYTFHIPRNLTDLFELHLKKFLYENLEYDKMTVIRFISYSNFNDYVSIVKRIIIECENSFINKLTHCHEDIVNSTGFLSYQIDRRGMIKDRELFYLRHKRDI